MNHEVPEESQKEKIRRIININPDARHYFFVKVAQADKKWLAWLWQNGFLDSIKQKAEDPAKSEWTPELGYLLQMAEKAPKEIVDIMLETPISDEEFNPAVAGCFLQICSTLPAEHLSRIVEKIRDERWIPLMGEYLLYQNGHMYQKMLEKLVIAEDYGNLLTLAEAMLSVRARSTTHNLFHVRYLPQTKFFKCLANVNDEYAEAVFALALRVMGQIINSLGKESQDEVFEVDDQWILAELDFFDTKPDHEEHISSEGGVRELAIVIATLARRLTGDKRHEATQLRTLYRQYIDPLPQSAAMWRLRLFVWSLRPDVFKDELKGAFFRIFEVGKSYSKILSGNEYLKALQKGFPALSGHDKRDYVRRIMEYFTPLGRDPKEKQHLLHYGSQILSMIEGQLTQAEKHHAREAGFDLVQDYQPEPMIGRMEGGLVVPRGPVTQEAFGKLPVSEIIARLQNEWQPEQLIAQNTSDDFLNPLNAEGVGKLLKDDIPNRLQDYADNANDFFDPERLDPHYTHAFLNGIQETIKNQRESAVQVNWNGVMDLCHTIKEYDGENLFEQGKSNRDWFDTLLVGWTAVHSTMAGVLKALMAVESGSSPIDVQQYRDRLLETIAYLLSHPDPSPVDEQGETAIFTTQSSGDAGSMVGDPFTMAINTVRGRAFDAFVSFVHREGNKFKTEDEVAVADDVRELYESVLKKENTRALIFMFGYYLPTFYFRDSAWIRGLLPQIFPREPERKNLYTAAWEGYLSKNLYEGMFFDSEIHKLYERGLALTDADYPNQKHFRDPGEGIATHLALAFMHYEDFGIDSPLLDMLRRKSDTKYHAEFVKFLGRAFVENMTEKPLARKRLKEYWIRMLERDKQDFKPLAQFAFWINPETFEPEWLAERIRQTLEKLEELMKQSPQTTQGALDWNYELRESIVRLAEEAPTDTLAIIRLYLFEIGVRGGNLRMPFYFGNEWHNAIRILHGNRETKSETGVLINKLISEGGKLFWELGEILNSNA